MEQSGSSRLTPKASDLKKKKKKSSQNLPSDGINEGQSKEGEKKKKWKKPKVKLAINTQLCNSALLMHLIVKISSKLSREQ